MLFFTRKAAALPPDWPSPFHNKCSARKCRHANAPQVAPGTYRCTGVPGGFFCEGTYKVSARRAKEAMSAARAGEAVRARDVGRAERDMRREREVEAAMERERREREEARRGQMVSQQVGGVRGRREGYERVEGSYEAQGRAVGRGAPGHGACGRYDAREGRYGSTTPTSSGTSGSASNHGHPGSASRYGHGHGRAYAESVAGRPERFPGRYEEAGEGPGMYGTRSRRPSQAQIEEEYRADEAMMRRYPERHIRPRWI